ncbi:dicarboxylate symporter family protein [Anoxybacillus sp. B7M1]|jgi:aerobic C4-dicarboxylate transport protein|uniref:Proton/sodium-glutamate symport protein n=1 Tax=Anoxybacteroides rupiense TaxID=311460 RepID=A0ABD5IYS6_9BACL|nr:MULTISPECIES: dicarboxylate/amino acid:cation symporter [Anoxybacillus]ANB58743.1 dicarboxylate symporter family protein [Anoxybacillus sp. B2M1]ANB64812.1 dicarboxylate symporter family protein [Anoxybacillus sp. B7M1]KXG09983.1 C4-dicarboxylate transport protein [Anoxybacillus sp. P3H1B]MBB3907687.1 aerobic C4-dicarboxylate transport protein [Anoxybacillus rupiensis]MED5053523.1 dicarboxylate/amino acid:cation symporter [Anoxybacillus rupiensis]
MRIHFKNLTVQVLTGIVLGILVGFLFPDFGTQLKVLADGFIKLIKMLIAPIIFFTVVIGIGNMGDLKKVGRIGGKALIYFEIVTTFALAIGIIVVNLIKPGAGVNIDAIKGGDVSQYTKQAEATDHGIVEFLLSIIPDNVVGAMAKGDLLPILFFAVLFGLATAAMGEKAKPVVDLFERLADIFFRIVNMVMKVSPLAAFGAMAYTIGTFGLSSLVALGKLMGSVYMTMFLFIVLVLGAIAKFYRFSIFKFIAYIKDEILLVLGTSSSESALPKMMEKLEKYGCSKSVVGLVVPTGYSFNLDGTSIYLSMAAMFIAQAYGIDLTIWQELTLLGVLMLTSKGAAGVTGSGFITLAATLTAFPMIPVEGIALLLGVDRFMSEARAITNLIGNGVATVVVSKMEKEFHTEGNPEMNQKMTIAQ